MFKQGTRTCATVRWNPGKEKRKSRLYRGGASSILQRPKRKWVFQGRGEWKDARQKAGGLKVQGNRTESMRLVRVGSGQRSWTSKWSSDRVCYGLNVPPPKFSDSIKRWDF
jgi:hypothetical protein